MEGIHLKRLMKWSALHKSEQPSLNRRSAFYQCILGLENLPSLNFSLFKELLTFEENLAFQTTKMSDSSRTSVLPLRKEIDTFVGLIPMICTTNSDVQSTLPILQSLMFYKEHCRSCVLGLWMSPDFYLFCCCCCFPLTF